MAITPRLLIAPASQPSLSQMRKANPPRLRGASLAVVGLIAALAIPLPASAGSDQKETTFRDVVNYLTDQLGSWTSGLLPDQARDREKGESSSSGSSETESEPFYQSGQEDNRYHATESDCVEDRTFTPTAADCGGP